MTGFSLYLLYEMINDVEAVIWSDGCCETVTIVHCAIITKLYFDQLGEQMMFWPITAYSVYRRLDRAVLYCVFLIT